MKRYEIRLDVCDEPFETSRPTPEDSDPEENRGGAADVGSPTPEDNDPPEE